MINIYILGIPSKNMKKGFTGIVYMFVGLTVAVVLVASVVLPQVFAANQTLWDTGTTAIWSVLGISIVAALILMVFGGK